MSDDDFQGGKGGAPTPFTNAFDHTQLNSLRYNVSQAGSPIPIAFGTVRATVNVIEIWGFKSSGSSGAKGGGKGLGSSGGKKGGNASYSVNVAFALCQGSVTFTGAPYAFSGHNRVWANGSVVGNNSIAINLYAGNDGQAPDPVFASSDPNQPVLGYSGTAYVTGTPMQLGSSPALPNFQVELGSNEVGTIGAGFPGDANPSKIIQRLLTDLRWGAGFPAANLDAAGSFADYATYCQATELAMSLFVDRQQPAARWVDEVAQLTVAAFVWSGSLLKIIPYSDQTWTANGATWVPNLTAQYSLVDTDFIEFGADTDPVMLSPRSDPYKAANWISLEYLDAANSYNAAVMPDFDQGLIDRYGLRQEPHMQAHEFTNPTSAAVAARLILQRKAYLRNTYKFKLGFRFSRLEPMDIVAITEPALGLDQIPVRIIQIDEDDNGELSITAEELTFTNFSIPVRQSTVGGGINFLSDPGNANTPIIFEPGEELTGGGFVVCMIASGIDPNWGGCEVWISTDNSSYARAGVITRGARQGFSTADFPYHGDPDSANTLSVNLAESLGTLLSGSLDDADNFVTLCYIDGELISYQTATLTSSNHYDLTYIRRGIYGSTISSHPSGSQFSRFGPNDPSLFKYEYPASFVGQTIYIKLVSFNIFGQRLQDISTLTAFTYILGGNGGGLPRFTVAGWQSGLTIPSQIIARFSFRAGVVFGDKFTSSQMVAATAATASTTYSIRQNGTPVGTIVFGAGSFTGAFTSVATTTAFSSGQELTIVAPASPDATLAGLSWELIGNQVDPVPAAEIHGSYSGATIPNLIIGRWMVVDSVNFPVNLYGSFAVCEVPATVGATYSIQKNGIEFGTFSFAAGGFVATFAGAAVTINPGDIVTIVAPTSPDSTLSNIAWVLTGEYIVTNPLPFIYGSVTGPLVSNLVIYRHVFARGFVIPPNLANSVAAAGTTSTGTAVFNVEKNGVSVGTMTFSAGFPAANFSAAAPIAFNAGDELQIVAPAGPDAALAGLAWAIAGNL